MVRSTIGRGIPLSWSDEPAARAARERRCSVRGVPHGEYTVRDNPAQLRYEIVRDGELLGSIWYRLEPGVVVLVHTEVEPSAEGHGVGGMLVRGALDDIRARGLKMAPVCPFVFDYVKRHPDQRDLVVRDPAIPE